MQAAKLANKDIHNVCCNSLYILIKNFNYLKLGFNYKPHKNVFMLIKKAMRYKNIILRYI